MFLPVRGGVLLLLAFGACGQDQGDSTANDSGDPFHPKTTIVVTATRAEEELRESPASTSLVTRPEIEARKLQTVDDALSMMEGIYIQRSKGPADTLTRATLRGFNGANRTLVLLDGHPVNDAYNGEVPWTTLPIEEVDRVEVVRGAYSSLYGGEALGGVINVLTRPISRREFEIDGSYGSNDTSQYSVRFADRFFNRLGISLSYLRLQSGGYYSRTITTSAAPASTGTPVTGVTPLLTNSGAATYGVGQAGRNWYNQHAYRVKGDYAFGDATTVNFQYIRQDYGYGYNAYVSSLRDPAGNVVDNGTFLFNLGGVLRRLTVTPGSFLQGPGSGYSHFFSGSVQRKLTPRQFLRLDVSYYNQPSYSYRTPGAAATPFGGAGTYNDRTSRNYHGNIQDNWQKSSRHSFVFGAETRHDLANNNVFATPDWTSRDSKAGQTYYAFGRTVNQAFYAQDQVHLGERFQLVAGGRYDYWKTYDGRVNTYSASAPLTSYPDRTSNSGSGKLALVYSAPREWVFHASVGTAFRNPNIYDLYNTSLIGTVLYEANPNLQSEKLKSWEAGFRKRFGDRMDLEAAYYENYIDGLIYRKTITPTDRISVNAGAGRTRGFEMSGTERLVNWLRLRGTYAYTNAIITKNPAVESSEGKRVPYVPAHTATGELLAFRKRWTGSLTARYQSRVFSSDANTDTTKGVPGGYDPFFLMGTTLGYSVNAHLEVYGSVQNLLDRQYYLYYLALGRTATAGLKIRL
jgi:iron complex outermembrane receptor protein